jgi:hypothetical protein
MLRSIPKSGTAKGKLSVMSDAEIDVLELHVAAAFLDPTSKIQILDSFDQEAHGSVFEIVIAEIDVAVLALIFSKKGNLGLLDLYVRVNLLDQASLPQLPA